MALKIRNEEEYQALLAQISSKTPVSAREQSSQKAPRAKPIRKNPVSPSRPTEAAAEVLEALVEEVATGRPPPLKRRGVEETPILTSLRNCQIDVEVSDKHATILFTGARLFTLNEIYAVLQYRKYVVFAYKKQWHSMVQNALRLMGNRKPRFEGPCKVTLFRQGKRPVDRDSLMVMFKYIIDALKDDKKNRHVGVFPDDNPDIVFDDEKIQTVGEPMVGIRVDLICPPPQIGGKDARDLFQHPPACLGPTSVDNVQVETPTQAKNKKAKTLTVETTKATTAKTTTKRTDAKEL